MHPLPVCPLPVTPAVQLNPSHLDEAVHLLFICPRVMLPHSTFPQWGHLLVYFHLYVGPAGAGTGVGGTGVAGTGVGGTGVGGTGVSQSPQVLLQLRLQAPVGLAHMPAQLESLASHLSDTSSQVVVAKSAALGEHLLHEKRHAAAHLDLPLHMFFQV